jgi:hypothetical protein
MNRHNGIVNLIESEISLVNGGSWTRAIRLAGCSVGCLLIFIGGMPDSQDEVNQCVHTCMDE